MAREIRLSGIGDHFEKQVINTVRKATFKAEKDILKALESLDTNLANYIIIESKYLSKNSLITSLFKNFDTMSFLDLIIKTF